MRLENIPNALYIIASEFIKTEFKPSSITLVDSGEFQLTVKNEEYKAWDFRIYLKFLDSECCYFLIGEAYSGVASDRYKFRSVGNTIEVFKEWFNEYCNENDIPR